MKLSEWKLYSIYALGHILQGSPEADEKYRQRGIGTGNRKAGTIEIQESLEQADYG